jgi:hypothetical protein
MITLPKTIQFTFPGASYVDWTIVANNTCVTIDKTSDRSNTGTFSVTINAQFTDSTCISTTVLTVTGVDNNMCKRVSTVTFTNPCTTLDATIAPSGELKVTATVTGGVSPYTTSWEYDTSKFVGVRSSNTIRLVPVDPANLNINTTPVYFKVTDVNGCSVTESYSVAVPQVNFPNTFSSVATCYQNVLTWTLYIDNADLYDKTYLNVFNEDITAVWDGWFLKFTIPGIDYDFQHDLQLKTTTGKLTQVAVVSVASNLCTELNIPALRVNTSIGATTVGATKTYNLTDDGNIDYSAFKFVPSSGQTLTGGILTTGKGTAELLSSKQIKYTVGTVGFDRVRFKAADTSGNPTEQIDLYIDPYNYPTPTASNFSLTGSVGALIEDNLQARFSDSIRSFEIVTAPTKGSLSFNETTLRYLAISTGSDSIVLKGIGLNNISSANVTITITNVASGVAMPGTVCNGGNINLTSLLTDYTAGGTWTQASGTSVSLSNPAIVPFSGKPSGFYTFNYAVGATSTDVTVEHRQYSVSSTNVGFLLPAGNNPNTMRFTANGCSSDITISNLKIKIFRAIAPTSPSDPSSYYETVAFTSLVSGTAIKDYSTTCNTFNYLAKVYVDGVCGEQLLGSFGSFACS